MGESTGDAVNLQGEFYFLLCFFWRFVAAFFSPFGLGLSFNTPIDDITPDINPLFTAHPWMSRA